MDITGYFGEIRETSEGFNANCPRCGDDSRKFYYNIEKGVGCCFHSECPWFKEAGGVTEKRLQYFFLKRGVEFATPEIIKTSEEADVELPEEFKLVGDLPRETRADIYAYLGSRGLNRKLVEVARIGYCESGRWWGYMIFPVFDDEGEVAYWQARRYKNRKPKFYNPESSKKTELIYRVSTSRKPHKIVLVESIINTLTLESGYPNPKCLVLGLLGKSMSETQYDYVMTYKKWLREIVVGLDPDARREAVEIAAQFASRKIPVVRVMQLPENEDINTLGRERSWALANRAPVFSPKNRMKFLLGEAA